MTLTTADHPCDTLTQVNDVTAFLSFMLDQASRDRIGGITGEELRGLSSILRWVHGQIEGASEGVAARLEASEADMLAHAGLPETAFGDERLRRAWRDGFTRGLFRAETGGDQ